MKLLAVDLPSHGYNSKLDSINISPMTYREMIKYDEDYSKDKIKQLLVDIELLRRENRNIDELNFYDLESVITTKKIISVTSLPSITLSDIICEDRQCRHNNSFSVPINAINYSNFEVDLISKIDSLILGGQGIPIKVPKIRDVVKLAQMLQLYKKDIDWKIFQALSFFDLDVKPNDIMRAVDSASKDEILLLEYIRNLMSGETKRIEYTCSKCGRKESVRINCVLTGMFRLLQINEKLDKSKIVLSQGM